MMRFAPTESSHFVFDSQSEQLLHHTNIRNKLYFTKHNYLSKTITDIKTNVDHSLDPRCICFFLRIITLIPMYFSLTKQGSSYQDRVKNHVQSQEKLKEIDYQVQVIYYFYLSYDLLCNIIEHYLSSLKSLRSYQWYQIMIVPLCSTV